jgi:RimJ/RimL family protein N-acetyltransferase
METVLKFSARNGSEITLRPATPDDAAGIIKTLKSPAQERSYVLTEQVGKSIQSERNYLSLLNTQRNLMLAATSDDEVVGVLAIMQAEEGRMKEPLKAGHIGLHIAEAFRGLGIGTHMLDYAVEWAVEHGFKILDACIFTSNMVSLGIFEKAGFKEECGKTRTVRFGRECVAEVYVVKCLD